MSELAKECWQQLCILSEEECYSNKDLIQQGHAVACHSLLPMGGLPSFTLGLGGPHA